jgi:hypothetical protein
MIKRIKKRTQHIQLVLSDTAETTPQNNNTTLTHLPFEMLFIIV